MKIEILNNYMTDENTYIIYENNDAVVIDPGNSADKIIKTADELGKEIKYILLTHCHYDHIEFLEELREKTGAMVVSSDKCSVNIGDPNINLTLHGLGHEIFAKKSDIIMSDGDVKNFCGIDFKCIYTPGHTNCGVCYLAEDNLFAGDTLFLRSVGRTDLPTGDADMLVSSIKNKLYTLDDDIKVYSGHGKPTTIGYEKKYNFFVKG